MPLVESGFGASEDVALAVHVLGVKFLSLEEFIELVARFGGSLGAALAATDQQEWVGRVQWLSKT